MSIANYIIINMNYGKLITMMIISFFIMYGVMFLNVDRFDHIYLSLSRGYMAILMVLPMAIVMLLMMGKMYPAKKWNTRIILGSLILFGLVIVFLKTQTLVGDMQYMKAMIPHHSSAIMTSKNAKIRDPQVRELSLKIIQLQEEEITLMKNIMERMKNESPQP